MEWSRQRNDSMLPGMQSSFISFHVSFNATLNDHVLCGGHCNDYHVCDDKPKKKKKDKKTQCFHGDYNTGSVQKLTKFSI